MELQKDVPTTPVVPIHVVNKQISWLPFKVARMFVQSLQLSTKKEWDEFLLTGDLPYNIPSRPDLVYKSKGFIGWRDWVGFEWLSFKDFVTYCRDVLMPEGINTSVKFGKIRKTLPANIPYEPEVFYKEIWPGWSEVFQTGFRQGGRKKGTMLPFEEAKQYVKEHLVPLGITSIQKWRTRRKEIPVFLPIHPEIQYKDKWIDSKDFFGKEKHDSPIRARRTKGDIKKKKEAIVAPSIRKRVSKYVTVETLRKKDIIIPERVEEKLIPLNPQIQELISELYTTEYERMVAFAHSYIKDEDLRRDIVNAALARIAHITHKRIFESLDHIRRYCYKVVRNKCIDYIREGRVLIFTDESLDIYHDSEEHCVDVVETHKNNLNNQLIKTLSKLPRMRKKVLEMYFFEHKTTSQIAEELDINSQTVLNHKARAIDALRADEELSKFTHL